jgi:hypothetical protein
MLGIPSGVTTALQSPRSKNGGQYGQIMDGVSKGTLQIANQEESIKLLTGITLKVIFASSKPGHA